MRCVCMKFSTGFTFYWVSFKKKKIPGSGDPESFQVNKNLQ